MWLVPEKKDCSRNAGINFPLIQEIIRCTDPDAMEQQIIEKFHLFTVSRVLKGHEGLR
jgi:hypothetical protein